MAGISSVQNFAPSVRTTTESKVDMQQIVSTGAQKATRVAGQSEENYVNLATSQISGSQQGTDEQYSHQRYIAYNAYINLGREQPLSPAEQFAQIQNAGQSPEGTDSTGTTQEAEEEKEVDPNTPRAANGEPLTEEEQAELQDMKSRDEEVRVHEQAHQSAGGQYASAPHYEYENGPDGKRYVTDGSVNIDVGEESDPQATIDKMQVVKRAALAPAQPSAQDRRVYAEASQKEAEARRELNEQRQEEAAAAQGQGQEQSQAASATGSNAASTSGATGTNATGNNTTGNVIGSRQAQPQTASNQPQAQQTTPEGTPSSSSSSSSIPDGPDTPSKLSQSTLGSNRSDDDVPELV